MPGSSILHCLPEFTPVGHEILWLATLWICFWEFREGQGGWMKPISYEWETGDLKRICIQEGPIEPCSVSLLFIYHISPNRRNFVIMHCFYFGEMFSSKLHNIPGDAKSMISKLSLTKLMVFCSWVCFLHHRITLLSFVSSQGRKAHIQMYVHQDTYVVTYTQAQPISLEE